MYNLVTFTGDCEVYSDPCGQAPDYGGPTRQRKPCKVSIRACRMLHLPQLSACRLRIEHEQNRLNCFWNPPQLKYERLHNRGTKKLFAPIIRWYCCHRILCVCSPPKESASLLLEPPPGEPRKTRAEQEHRLERNTIAQNVNMV